MHDALFDACLFKLGQLCCSFQKYLNKTGAGSFIVQGEMIYSFSVMIRPREIFDLECLNNHLGLSTDFHLLSALSWKLHKKPSTLELIRVITTLPIEWHTPPDVDSSSPHSLFFVLMFHTRLILSVDALLLMLKLSWTKR
ncbi:hypothetical protein AMECASPLE_024283 [Ameca splendens]|uniref:Uncharacterized protein n=1 Tax=Ameca splendens TaxID=208324 RepID=A0ABV0XTE3_9TELE